MEKLIKKKKENKKELESRRRWRMEGEVEG